MCKKCLEDLDISVLKNEHNDLEEAPDDEDC